MSVLLDSVRDEIDAEKARHTATMEKLREIEHLALGLAGAAVVVKPPPVEVAETPVPLPAAPREEPTRQEEPAKPAGRKRTDPRANGRKVLDVLRDGPASQAELTRETGLKKGTLFGTVKRLATDGEIVQVGEQKLPQGKPSKIWALPGQAAGPERAEPAGESETGPERSVETPPPATDPDAAERARAADEHRDRKDTLADHILEALKAGDRTLDELAGELETSKPRVIAAGRTLMASGRVQSFGAERNGSPIWRRVSLPHERDDVEISNGNGAVTETQVVECLRHGTYTVVELARELEVSAGEVALKVSRLEQTGRAERIADGKYRLCGVGV